MERTREWAGGGKKRGNNKVRGQGGALWQSRYFPEELLTHWKVHGR